MITVQNPTGHVLTFGERPEYGDRYRLVSVNGIPAHRIMLQPITMVAKSEVDTLPRIDS
jgi:hypothetical protein